MEEIIWKDHYNVGCDYVDNAHKKLFSVIRRVQNIIIHNEYEKDKFACMEAIKFLGEYTVTHFAQEEAFMREVDYKGFPMHKKIHDELRENTLPELIKELEETDYSRDSVVKFVSVFVGWLAGHILIEDRAITGKAISRWNHDANADVITELDLLTKKIFSDVTGDECKLLLHDGNTYSLEDAFYYRIDYPETKMVLAGQYGVIKQLTSIMFGEEQNEIDKNVLIAYVQFIQTLAKDVLLIANPEELAEIRSHQMILPQDLNKMIDEEPPKYNLKWEAKGGLLGLVLF